MHKTKLASTQIQEACVWCEKSVCEGKPGALRLDPAHAPSFDSITSFSSLFMEMRDFTSLLFFAVVFTLP